MLEHFAGKGVEFHGDVRKSLFVGARVTHPEAKQTATATAFLSVTGQLQGASSLCPLAKCVPAVANSQGYWFKQTSSPLIGTNTRGANRPQPLRG